MQVKILIQYDSSGSGNDMIADNVMSLKSLEDLKCGETASGTLWWLQASTSFFKWLISTSFKLGYSIIFTEFSICRECS